MVSFAMFGLMFFPPLYYQSVQGSKVLALLFLRPDRPAPTEPVTPADRLATGSVTGP